MEKVVIFDLDGVIIDSEIEVVRNFYHFCQFINKPCSMEVAQRMAGVSYTIFADTASKFIDLPKDEIWRKMQEHNRLYRKKPDWTKALIPDSKTLLQHLHANGYRIGLASSSNEQMIADKIDSHDIRHYFEFILDGDMIKHHKPNPEIYLKMAECMKVSPENMIAIEDSVDGIKAAHDAGYYVIGRYDSRINNNTSLADYTVDNLEKLIPYFTAEGFRIPQ